MKYLKAEEFYCEKLLQDMRAFTNNYKIYNDFMIEILDVIQSAFLGRNEKIKIYDGAENENLRLYGDRRSKIIIDVSNEFNRYISIELDFCEDYLLILNRLNKEIISKKREEKNFFNHKLFRKIDEKENRKKALEYIKNVFEG